MRVSIELYLQFSSPFLSWVPLLRDFQFCWEGRREFWSGMREESKGEARVDWWWVAWYKDWVQSGLEFKISGCPQLTVTWWFFKYFKGSLQCSEKMIFSKILALSRYIGLRQENIALEPRAHCNFMKPINNEPPHYCHNKTSNQRSDSWAGTMLWCVSLLL